MTDRPEHPMAAQRRSVAEMLTPPEQDALRQDARQAGVYLPESRQDGGRRTGEE